MKLIQKIQLDIKNAAGTVEAVVIDVIDLMSGKPLPTDNPNAAKIATIVKELISLYGSAEAALATPAVQAVITAIEAL
jgi:hypothetical protein